MPITLHGLRETYWSLYFIGDIRGGKGNGNGFYYSPRWGMGGRGDGHRFGDSNGSSDIDELWSVSTGAMRMKLLTEGYKCQY